MQFPEAYSHQWPGVINVDQAVWGFNQGLLNNPKGFQCPDVLCSAPLRLNALAGALSGNTPGKRDPYFSTDGERDLHDPQCEFLMGEKKVHGFVRTRPNWKDDLKNIKLDDVFDLARPNLVRTKVAGMGANGAPSPAQRSIIAALKAQRQNLNHYSLLETVVDRFQGMPAGLAAQKCIRIGTSRVPYCDAFVPFLDLGTKGLGANLIRIYFGEALLKVNKNSSGGYGFYLVDHTTIGGNDHRGVLWVRGNELRPKPGSHLAPGITRIARRIADALAGKDSKLVMLYVLGGYRVSVQNLGPKHQLWVNLQPQNLDHVFFSTT